MKKAADDALVESTDSETPAVKRRKAVFSCDRCKTRKRKCVRFINNDEGEKTSTFDIVYPCEECIQSKSICHTYLGQRKQTTLKKLSLTESALTKDCVGQDSEAKMKELEIKCQYLVSLLKQVSPDIKTDLFQDDDTSPLSVASTSSSDQSSLALELHSKPHKLPGAMQMEEIKEFSSPIDERKSLSHDDYIGPLGSSTLHETVIGLIGSPGSLRSSSTDLTHSVTGENLLLGNDMRLKFYDNNQLVYSIPRQEADQYVCEFFDRIHLICNCIDKEEFVRIYELFWLLLKHEDLRSINSTLFLSSPQICTIYLIWILGKRFKHRDDMSLSDTYMSIIQTTLSEIILRPSEAGIQMAILFSLYLESTHSRESAWIVIETAVTQAISIGMNKVKSSSVRDIDEKNKGYSKIWCTLFAQEVRLSNVMGRQSSIDFTEADVRLPKFQQLKYSNLPKYWVQQINSEEYQLYFNKYYELNKIFHEFLRYRSSVMEGTSIYTISSIKKAWELRSKFHAWINGLPPTLKNIFDKPPTSIFNYQVYLHLTYHYYFINLGLPFLMLILRIMQSERHIKLKKTDPIFVLAISAISCSKQLFTIINFEFEKDLFNGSVYNDIYILYHSTLIFTIAIVVVSNKNAESILDLKYLEAKKNVSKEKIWHIISKIGELNKKLQPLTSGSNREVSQNIEMLVENVSHFLAYDRADGKGDIQALDQSPVHTPNSKPFNNKLDSLFHTMNMNTDELWKMINWDWNSYEGGDVLFKEFNELDSYFKC